MFPLNENVSVLRQVAAYFTKVGLRSECGIASNETSNVKKESAYICLCLLLCVAVHKCNVCPCIWECVLVHVCILHTFLLCCVFVSDNVR